MLSMLLAALSLAPADPGIEADVVCVAVLGAIISQTPEAERAGLTAGTMYYIGRIEGRDPAYDLEAGILAAVPTDRDKFTTFLRDESKRCGDEMQRNGARLQALGAALGKRDQAPAK